MLRSIFTSIIFLAVLPCEAQELEYKMELGGALGGSFYMGDANNKLYKNTGGLIEAIARFNLNPRMAIKTNLCMGHIFGNTEGQFFPENANSKDATGGTTTTQSFQRNVYDLGAQYEYNFWAYGAGKGYKDSHRLTPYILMGFGFTFAPKPAQNVLAINIPLGMGLKYKLRERVNVGVEWSVHFSTTDKLDVSNSSGLQLNNPYGISSSGFKNKDSYVFTMLYLSYDLFPKYRKCNN